MLKVNYDLGIGSYENFINLVNWVEVEVEEVEGDQLLLSEATSGGRAGGQSRRVEGAEVEKGGCVCSGVCYTQYKKETGYKGK